MNTTETNLRDISLINREYLARLWSADPVCKTLPRLCQHGTGKKQIATGSTLIATPLPGTELALNIPFTEMNQQEPPHLADCKQNKTEIVEDRFKTKSNSLVSGSYSGLILKVSIPYIPKEKHILSLMAAVFRPFLQPQETRHR